MDPSIIESPQVEVKEDILEELLTQVNEVGQVIVHCIYQSSIYDGDKIRIWPSTYLYDLHSAHRSELVHVENITMSPIWTELSPSQHYCFSLIFTGLPSSCKVFDLIENIDQSGAFEVRSINRNDQDIYFVRI